MRNHLIEKLLAIIGQQHRVVPGQDDDRGAQAHPRGPRRQVGQQVEGRGYLAKPGEVMLNQEHRMVAELLGLFDIADKVPVALRAVARNAAPARRSTAKQSELHGRISGIAGPQPVNTSCGPARACRSGWT